MNDIIEKLTYFYNIGEKQAPILYEKLINLKLIKGNESLSDLRRILRKPEIFNDLSLATKTDLIYNPLRVIPRKIIQLINDEFHKYVLGPKFDVCGSFIRGKNTSGDIDLVLEINKWDYFNKNVNKSKIIQIKEPFAKGSSKISTLIEVNLINYPEFKNLITEYENKIYIKMDVFLSTLENYIFAKLFATGSGKFNIQMRYVAKHKGYLLNNNGLWKKIKNELIKIHNINNEKDIFIKLGIKYKEPHERI